MQPDLDNKLSTFKTNARIVHTSYISKLQKETSGRSKESTSTFEVFQKDS